MKLDLFHAGLLDYFGLMHQREESTVYSLVRHYARYNNCGKL